MGSLTSDLPPALLQLSVLSAAVGRSTVQLAQIVCTSYLPLLSHAVLLVHALPCVSLRLVAGYTPGAKNP